MAVATLRVPHSHTQPLLVDARVECVGRLTPTASEGKPEGSTRPRASLAANGAHRTPTERRVVAVNAAVPPYRSRSRPPYDGRCFAASYPMRGKRANREGKWIDVNLVQGIPARKS